jgi:hypothetical protein
MSMMVSVSGAISANELEIYVHCFGAGPPKEPICMHLAEKWPKVVSITELYA